MSDFVYEFEDAFTFIPRPEEPPGLNQKLTDWEEDHWNEIAEGALESFETYEPMVSRKFQVAKITKQKEQLKELDDDTDRQQSEIAATLDAILTITEPMNALMEVFGVGGITWNGFDVYALLGILKTITSGISDYLDAKLDYYNALPAKTSISYQSSKSYYAHIPDTGSVVQRETHKVVYEGYGFTINMGRNQTYKWLDDIMIARTIVVGAIEIGRQLSEDFAEAYNEFVAVMDTITNFISIINTVKELVEVAGPLLVRAASPNGETLASIFGKLLSMINTLLSWLEKIKMFMEFIIGRNNDYAKFYRESRLIDNMVTQFGATI